MEQLAKNNVEEEQLEISQTDINKRKKLFPEDHFWDDFFQNYWGKKTLSKKSDFISFPLDSDELFALCVDNSDPKSAVFNTEIGFYVDNKQISHNKCIKSKLYPQKNDMNFRNYENRLSDLYGEQEYVLKVDSLLINTKLDQLAKYTY